MARSLLTCESDEGARNLDVQVEAEAHGSARGAVNIRPGARPQALAQAEGEMTMLMTIAICKLQSYCSCCGRWGWSARTRWADSSTSCSS